MAQAKSKKMVMVGYKTLSADIVKVGDPISYGEVLTLTGDALTYAENSTYQDALGNIHNTFVDVDSPIGKRVLNSDNDKPAPRRRTRTRRSA